MREGGEVVGKEKKNGLLGTAAVMAVIVFAAKALGLLRDTLVANAYGMTAPAVAYETASRLPVLIFDFVIGGVVSAAFIPVFSDLLVREGKKSAMRYAASYVNLILLISAVLTAVGVVFASPLVDLLAPELAPDVKGLAVELTRILFPMVICTGLAFSFVGILQSMGEFRIPAMISLVSNLIMVGYLLFFLDDFGVHGLAVAMLCGWGAQALVQVPKLRQFGFRLSLREGIVSPHITRSLKLAVPILIGTWTQPICTVINTNFASAMNEGRAITALGYANRLYTIIVGVFAFVATNLLYPYFSRAVATGDTGTSRRLMFTSVKTLSFIIAPIAAGLAVLAQPIAAILYDEQSLLRRKPTEDSYDHLLDRHGGQYGSGGDFVPFWDRWNRYFLRHRRGRAVHWKCHRLLPCVRRPFPRLRSVGYRQIRPGGIGDGRGCGCMLAPSARRISDTNGTVRSDRCRSVCPCDLASPLRGGGIYSLASDGQKE